jgi:hypothetical protein
MQTTHASRLNSRLVLALAILGVSAGCKGCKKDEPPPPLPSAAPVTAPPPTAPIELVPEEPAPPPSASASATAKPGGVGVSSSLKKCCSALTQNAANAPEPNKTYMLQAAAVCNAAVAAGQSSGAVVGAVSAALRGAGMPGACK